jgi:hypothetical protein
MPSKASTATALRLNADQTSKVETSHQLAFTLFEQLANEGAGVDSVPDKVGFHRNNVFIEIQDLSSSARRALDVLYFIAAEDQEIRKEYVADLSYFKWLMAYNSNNRAHLRQIFREAQRGAVQLDQVDENTAPNERFVSIPLLGTFGFNKGQVQFELNEPLQRAIKNPANSHFLSLRYVFKNLYAKILYDKLLPHLKIGVTPWVSIETLRKWFSLEPDSYTEFKRLSERTIRPSVKQINEVTGLVVTFTTRNVPGSKKVADICFQIRSPNGQQEAKGPLYVLKEQYYLLRDEFGLSGAQLAELSAERSVYTEERIQRAIEYTRYKLKKGLVKVPSAYLMKAIKDDYTLGTAQIDADSRTPDDADSATPAITTADQLKEHAKKAGERVKAESHEGYEAYKEMPIEDQERLLDAFLSSPAAKVTAMFLKVDMDSLKDLASDHESVQESLGAFVVHQARQQTKKHARQAKRS